MRERGGGGGGGGGRDTRPSRRGSKTLHITRMNVNSFQDRENVTPCQEIAKQRPSKSQVRAKHS